MITGTGQGRFPTGIRHDFDGLHLPQKPRVALRRVFSSDFEPLMDLAQRTIGGGLSGGSAVQQVIEKNPNSVLVFTRQQVPVGFWAMLLLNPKGLEALLAGELDPSAPAPSLLVTVTEPPAAIYVWAVVAQGLASEGIQHVSAFLRQPLYAHANLYTRAATVSGGNIMAATGFLPIQSAVTGLHRYVRHANRHAPNAMSVAA